MSRPSKFDSTLLDAKLQQCAEELPDGYIVEISVERGSGWLNLFDGKGDLLDFPCNREYGLVEQVIDALEYAKQHAEEKAG